MSSSPPFTLRVATPMDAAVLSAIASTTFVDTFGHLYSAEDLQNYLAEAYNIDTIRAEIEDLNKYTVLLFAKDNAEKPAGYAMLDDKSVRTGDTGRSVEDYLEVKRVYIDKPFHGKGAAYMLMDHVMEIVKQKNRPIVWLGVWEENIKAQKFYEKYGFEETGAHTFTVGATEDRDLLFTLKQK